MSPRRNCLIGMSALAATAGTTNGNTLYKVLKAGPRPKLIPSNRTKVDLGHGLLVPMSKVTFHTLWGGDDRWISYGPNA